MPVVLSTTVQQRLSSDYSGGLYLSDSDATLSGNTADRDGDYQAHTLVPIARGRFLRILRGLDYYVVK